MREGLKSKYIYLHYRSQVVPRSAKVWEGSLELYRIIVIVMLRLGNFELELIEQNWKISSHEPEVSFTALQ